MEKKRSAVKVGMIVLLTLALLLTVTSCSLLRSPTNNTIDGTYKLSVGEQSGIPDSNVAQTVAANTMPSVLEITSTQKYGSYTYSSGGTGFVITEDGYVVTNSHVIHFNEYNRFTGEYDGPSHLFGDGNIKLRFYSSDIAFDVTVVAFNESKDLAILKFVSPPENLQALTFGDSEHDLYYGEIAVAIGNANGLGIAVTTGVISAPSRTFDNEDGTTTEAIQTDAAINPGNSGGPLFNRKSQVVGVNSFKLVTDETENMGYAIPAHIVVKFIKSVENSKGITIDYNQALTA